MSVRRFLSPGWILGFLAAVLFTVACLWFLAPWQLGKNAQLNARNDRLAEASQAAPIPLSEAQNTADAASIDWHLVTARGRFDTDPQHTVLVRLRPVDGNQAYQVLVPFYADNGTTVLVNRGWVPVGDAGAVPTFAAVPAQTVSITGRWRMPESQAAEPTQIHGFTTVKTFNVGEIATLPQLAGTPLQPQYLALTKDQPGALGYLPTPGIETGPYLSYGLQWIAFGIIAPAAVIYFLVSAIRARRRGSVLAAAPTTAAAPTAAPSRAGTPSNAPASRSHPSPDDASSSHISQAPPPPRPEDEMLASRYGNAQLAAERRKGRRSRSRF